MPPKDDSPRHVPASARAHVFAAMQSNAPMQSRRRAQGAAERRQGGGQHQGGGGDGGDDGGGGGAAGGGGGSGGHGDEAGQDSNLELDQKVERRGRAAAVAAAGTCWVCGGWQQVRIRFRGASASACEDGKGGNGGKSSHGGGGGAGGGGGCGAGGGCSAGGRGSGVSFKPDTKGVATGAASLAHRPWHAPLPESLESHAAHRHALSAMDAGARAALAAAADHAASHIETRAVLVCAHLEVDDYQVSVW